MLSVLHHICAFVFALLVSAAISAATQPPEDLGRIISRGDIDRAAPPGKGKDWIPLYQANGTMGCCFGPWGLHINPSVKEDFKLIGVTKFMHIDHRVRAKFNADYLLPLAAIYWEKEPVDVGDYSQHQSFYDGTVRTHYRTGDSAVTTSTWIDPNHRNTAGVHIELEGHAQSIIIAPLRHLDVHYEQKLEQTFEAKQLDANTWQASIQCMTTRTSFTIRTNAAFKATAEGVALTIPPGGTDILITIGNDDNVSAADSLKSSIAAWHATWQKTAWLDLPDDRAQQLWVRSLAYILYSDSQGESTPTGFTGDGWPFPFPIDDSFRHPILLETGQLDAARAWVENWNAHLDGWREFTQRMWKHDGLMMPHVFPYGSFVGYDDPAPPNTWYFPLYNAGSLVRMAHYTAVMLNDPAWTQRYVDPLIDGTKEFFLNIAEKKSDGWHFTVIPSVGMDEYGGANQPDYICSLYAAEYVLRMAVQYNRDPDGRCAQILKDGIAYKSLLAPTGMYYSNAGSGSREFGHQKHPDQLFPLVFVPLGSEPDAAARRSYELRYQVTANANRRFAGHTLGQFILASARMHDVEGWRKDWSRLQPARMIDPEWISLYESSGNGLSYYVTTHGLFAQAILESLVSTWWGKLDLAACVPWTGEIRFGNVRTNLGVTVSGELNNGKGQATLTAWKDTTFTCQNKSITLKKGEQIVLPLK
jgi:hypothetical protein